MTVAARACAITSGGGTSAASATDRASACTSGGGTAAPIATAKACASTSCSITTARNAGGKACVPTGCVCDRFTIIPIPQHNHRPPRKGRREHVSYEPPPLSIPQLSAIPGGLFKQLVHGLRYDMDAGYRRRFLYGEDADGRLTHEEKYALGQEYLRVMDWVKANGKQVKRGAGGEFEEGQQAITAANLAMAWGVGKNGPRDYSKARSITVIL